MCLEFTIHATTADNLSAICEAVRLPNIPPGGVSWTAAGTMRVKSILCPVTDSNFHRTYICHNKRNMDDVMHIYMRKKRSFTYS